LVTLSASGGTVYIDSLTMNTVNVASPTLTWGQQFGYDGFGNLLSQTVLAGSAPSMSLSVNTSTNRVSNTGVTYDGAGNLTSDGTNSYSFDEMNRLTATGAMTYGYSAQDGKRMVAYNNTNPTNPTAVLNLYGPSGQRLSSITYYLSGGTDWVETYASTNYLYLGSKPLNYSDDRLGSNIGAQPASGWGPAQYYPYGQVQSGGTVAEAPAFGTYVQDESGLLYADQRYMYQNWGRFLTADPSNRNIDPTSSMSWNRYGYANEDPINGNDPAGTCDGNYAYCNGGWCPPSQASCGGYTLPTYDLNPTPSMGPATPDELASAYNQYAAQQQTFFLTNYLQWYLDPTRIADQAAQQQVDILDAIGSRLLG
jgi:RHS repeat-associated protein